ncbi:serine-rich adhesin for platelets-like [Clytia hemisphaerica]|uniref:Insulin receptor substrate 1 n=1 Tax=Clytia hemisphaerica TaxID=252671 RepID=A0A7M5WRZ0_9CNID
MSNKKQHIKQGYLLKCPQKALNPFKHKWQSRWFILHGNSEQGRVRLEYYDNEKCHQQEKGKRVIPLSHCVSIKPVWNKDNHHVIEIVIQDKTFHLAAGNKDEEKAWFKDLCKAVFGNANRNSIVQVLDKPSEFDFGYHSLDRTSLDGNTDSPRTLHTVEESLNESRDDCSRDDTQSLERVTGAMNDSTSVDGSHGSSEYLMKHANSSSVASELSSLVSFESGFDDGSSVASTVTEASSFPVTVRATIASQRSGMSGTYLLQVNPLNIVLIDVPTQKPVCEWPIQYLRRYGRGRTKFSFEASDKCKFGKGVYTFNTLEGDSIFHLVDMHARGISMRNQMLRKRTSMPEGFKPLGNTSKRLHHSEGKLVDKFSSDIPPIPNSARLADSVTDMNEILLIGPGDSVSQIGTLRSQRSDIEKLRIDIEGDHSRLDSRGPSIGSGISLEIAQNISQSGEELKCIDENKANTSSAFESTFTEDPRTLNTKPVSPIQEETIAQTLENESLAKPKVKSIIDQNGPNRTSTPDDSTSNTSIIKKPKISIKRSSSLKLPSALKRSNSSGKDNSVKKSSSVKRSSSFRSRFFKSKSSSDDEKKSEKKMKPKSKSAQDLSLEPIVTVVPTPTTTIEALDQQIAQEQKAKEILAKAIEDDMNRNSENEILDPDMKREKKRRRFPIRHKSNEMVENATPEKSRLNRLSNSFAGYDYKGHVVLQKRNSGEKEIDDEEYQNLQKRTQSVMKKVELYESLKRQAEDNRNNTSYTLWRKRQSLKETPKSKDITE